MTIFRFFLDLWRTYRALGRPPVTKRGKRTAARKDAEVQQAASMFDDLRAMAYDPDDDIEHYSETAEGLRPCKQGCAFCTSGDVLTSA